MFTVKATFRQETRKIKFNESISFPSYAQIDEQLRRIFVITSDYTLSRLLFSPDASKPDSRILIAQEVKDAEDYSRAIRPLEGRAASGGLLKFTVNEPSVCRAPMLTVCGVSAQPQTASGSQTQAPWQLAAPSGFNWASYAPPAVYSPASVIPPPPIIFSTPSIAAGLPLSTPSPANPPMPSPMDIDGMIGGSYPSLQTSLYNPNYQMSNMSNTRARANEFSAHAQFRGTQPQLVDLGDKSVSSSASVSSTSDTSSLKLQLDSVRNSFQSNMDRAVNDCLASLSASFAAAMPATSDRTVAGAWPEVPTAAQIEESMAWRRPSTEQSSDVPAVPAFSIPAHLIDREATPTPTEQAVHHNIVCDKCDGPVVGIRHKCLDCPDFDLCTACIQSGSAEAHNPFHEFFEINEPGRVVVHTVYSNNGSVSPGPGSAGAPAVTPAAPVVHNAICNLCDSRIYGERFKCAKCPDYDTCAACFAITSDQHPYHSFVKLREASDLFVPELPREAEHFATCDSCNQSIRGIRYKCMHTDCPDFDLCAACESLPIPVHDPNHPLLKIKTDQTVIPATHCATQSAPSRCTRNMRRCTRDDDNSRPLPTPPRRHHHFRSTPVPEVPDTAPSVPAAPVVHRASCNMCESRIYGARFKCLNCLDFDTCTSCFEITAEQHPGHGFVKISNPADLIIRNALSSDVMHHALCDSCNQTILGTRWKCMHPECPDYDLCSSCKSHPIAVHPSRHPMLEMKTTDTVIPTVYRVGKTTMMPKTMAPLASTVPVPVQEEVERPSLVSLIADLMPTTYTAETNKTDIVLPAEEGQLISTPDDEHEFMTPVLTEKELMSSVTSAEPLLIAPVVSEMIQTSPAVTTHKLSLAALLNGYRSPSPTPASTLAESMSSLDLSQGATTPPVVPAKEQTAGPAPLKASFVNDVTVPDGQILPPGAEFVKSWRVKNDGSSDWPATAELHFTGGEKMTADSTGPVAIRVGSLSAGTEVDIWTGELKAPETAGNYRSYWHLSDGNGNLFGHLLWIDINVAEAATSDSSESSMASSSVIMMPQSAASAHSGPSVGLRRAMTLNSETSKLATDDSISDAGSIDSSISLVSVPSSEEDRADWHDATSPQETRGADFVVVYASSDEE